MVDPGDGDPVGGFAVAAESTHGWVTVERDGDSGVVTVRLRPGSLRGRTEDEVAQEIRSGLLTAARAYTARYRDERRREYGALPEEIVEWGRLP